MNDSVPGAPGPAAPLPVVRRPRWARIRPWVQTAFLGVWLAPLGRWLHGFPGCTFHCYSCPLSSFACPVGIAANYAAVFPVFLEVPYLLLGVLLLVGGLAGSLACGWACPFGFLQDLLAKITRPRLRLPAWLSHFRYVVLAGLVIALPMYLGWKGTPYDEQSVSICRLCPAGALEAGLPYSLESLLSGRGWLMGWHKVAILAIFFGAALITIRPWCKVFCPLGGFLALFNRWSLFHLRYKAGLCRECPLCRTRCWSGVKVDTKINTTECIRCLECATCGAIEPHFALPQDSAGEKPPGCPTSPTSPTGQTGRMN